MMARLRHGLPLLLVAGIAASALVAMVVVSALRDETSPVGFAQLRVTGGGCYLNKDRSRNAFNCSRASRGIYAVTFSKDLDGRVTIASRSTCCPGEIGAEIQGGNRVLVVLPGVVDYPVVFSVSVP